MPAVDETNIDWDEVVKKEARWINDADFGDKKKILLAKKPCR